MLSNKPYLVRAFYEWITDSGCTPLLVVDATLPRCNVPQQFVENGEIILNVSKRAIRDLKMSANLVEFKASFSGIAHLISVPMYAVTAIYAEENNQGMDFEPEDISNIKDNTSTDFIPSPSMKPDSDNISPNKGKGHLKLVE